MSKQNYYQILNDEVSRIDKAQVAKRHEIVIDGFTQVSCPRAIVNGQEKIVFNSNDYLGLRHHPLVKEAEHQASQKYGAGPGAVRFISGTLKVHRQLEESLAKFHQREDAIIFSSAFGANFGGLFALIKGQSKDSLLQDNVLVVSDELNHRSIIDGIRIANLPSESRAIFKHMDANNLGQVLKNNSAKFDRVLVVTDGVFSMLGEIQKLNDIRRVVDQYDTVYKNGVLLVVDDCHGIAACGQTGRGTEEIMAARADVLVGTMGKGLGADGGYIVADKAVIDYLRESVATYIYSNNIAPGTAGATLQSLEIIDSGEGQKLLERLATNVKYFKEQINQAGFTMAADSSHPIQPILIADANKTMAFKQGLFDEGFLVTNINYPVVPKGKDEIRVQLSAAHSQTEIDLFISAAVQVGQKLGIIK